MEESEGIYISFTDYDDVILFHIAGRLDTDNILKFKDSVENALKRNKFNLIFEMGDVFVISSSALGTILSLYKKIRQKNGSMKFCNISPVVARTFLLTTLDHIFEIYSDESSALRSYGIG